MVYLGSRKREILSTVWFILFNASVQCIANTKSNPNAPGTDRWKEKDTLTSGSNLWQPEYYEGPYSNRKDFVTSSYEDKYSSNTPSYGTKNRLGFSPFSGGSVYTPGGLYERRPTFGAVHQTDYGAHDYEAPYEYGHHGHGFGLNYPQGAKDLTRSVVIPLAGAALLGIAAALVANPVLLHLGVSAGKRKRRDVASTNAHKLAYRAKVL